MGAVFSIIANSRKEFRVIYLEDMFKKLHPIAWDPSFGSLLECLERDFDYMPVGNILVFTEFNMDAKRSSRNVVVHCQRGYDALVPAYRKIEPDMHLFYYGIDLRATAAYVTPYLRR
jgi:hypothetical protein